MDGLFDLKVQGLKASTSKFTINIRSDSSVGIRGTQITIETPDVTELDYENYEELLENLDQIGQIFDAGAGFSILIETEDMNGKYNTTVGGGS